jgi:DsbC/DsbD-like thiol-disulfide interchange protein
MRITQRIVASLLFFICSGGMVAASAQDKAPTENGPAKLQLVAEEAAYQPGVPMWVGVIFRIDPGWHIYWQNPGDSGTPPKIIWRLPKGFHVGEVRWPLPVRLGKAPVIDYGYQGQVLLMAPVLSPPNSIAPATIVADVEYVVCSGVCIPAKTQLTLMVPPVPGRTEHPSPSSSLFEATRKQFPRPAPDSWDMSAELSRKGFLLTVNGITPKGNVTFFPLDTGLIDNAAPQTQSAIDDGFSLMLPKSDLLTRYPRKLHGVLDIPGMGAFEIEAPVTAAPPSGPVSKNGG